MSTVDPRCTHRRSPHGRCPFARWLTISRLSDGTRKIAHITEVSGMEVGVVTMSDIFKFEQTGIGTDGKILGSLRATGLRPLFTPRLEVFGYKLRPEIFGAKGAL